MAISESQARKIAEDMIRKSGRNVAIVAFNRLECTNGTILYCFDVEDLDTGEYYYPGELFKSILDDGSLIDFSIPPPAF